MRTAHVFMILPDAELGQAADSLWENGNVFKFFYSIEWILTGWSVFYPVK